MKTFLMISTLLATGLASAQGTSTRIVDESQLGRTHLLAVDASHTAPGYPTAYAGTGDDVCIALGYTIRPDGTTGDFHLLRAWSSDREAALADKRYLEAYAAAAADLVASWRFVSGPAADGAPVMTVATMAFEGQGRAKKLTDRCRIPQLASYYRKSGEDGSRWLLEKRNRQHVDYAVGRMNVAQNIAQWINDHHASN